MLNARGVAFVLGLLVFVTYAEILQEYKVETITDEWSGEKYRIANAVVGARTPSGNAALEMTALRTSTQPNGSEGTAWIKLWCKQIPANTGTASFKVTYADSSSKVITQMTTADGDLVDIPVHFDAASEDGDGYWFLSGYNFRADEYVLKNAVKLVAKVTWYEPYVSAMASLGTGYFVFGATDLSEVRKVLNYEFSKE